MRQNDLEDVLALEKQMYAKLTEFLGMTEELAEAVDRQDPVSIRMLLAMRQTSVIELQELQGRFELKECDLPRADAERCRQLLEGKTEPLAGEEALDRQVVSNQRLLRRTIALDRQVSRRLAGERSCYGT